MGALNDIVRSGKARYIGVSTMLTGQLAKILMACERNGWVKPINMVAEKGADLILQDAQV